MNQAIHYDITQVMPEALATGLFVSLFTAQQPDGVFGSTGAPDGGYINVVGLVNIPCMSPPLSEARISANEMKTIEEVAATELHHVLLNSWYPTLDAGWRNGWRCIVDGTAYDILGVESDSQMQMTRVLIRLETL